MKRNFLVLGVLLMMVWLAGCARVNLGLDKDENIKFDRAGGYANPERGLDILEQQSRTQTLVLLQKQLRMAIQSGDENQINKILRMMDAVNDGPVAHEYRWLCIRNDAPNFITNIFSEPFAGITLTPGQQSKHKKSIPVGIYKLVYEECEIGGDRCRKKTANVSIGPKRTMPIRIYE